MNLNEPKEITTKDLGAFLKRYEKYVREVLIPTHDEIKKYFSKWQTPYYWADYTKNKEGFYPSPVRAIFTRIKRPERVVDKILHRQGEYPDGLTKSSFQKMYDTIGVRIVVYFISQLPYIDRELRKSSRFEISKRYPPEAYLNEELCTRIGLSHMEIKQKESGYASIHYNIRLKSSKIARTIRPYFELQVRTLAQELWCEMEHILAYKSVRLTDFSAKKRFQILSREIEALDEHFNLLYEEALHKHESADYVKSDELNITNLPPLLKSFGIQCSQQDLNTILSLLKSRGVESIGDLAGLATPKRLETIRNTFVSRLGRHPESFETIACLAALQGISPDEKESKHIYSQIEFSQLWQKLRKEELTAKIDNKEQI